jgi:hypothetical protein
MITASRPSCAPGWETQHTSRPPRTAGPSRAHARYGMGWRTNHNGRKARRKAAAGAVISDLFALGQPDTIAPAEPGHRVEVGQHSLARG